MAVKDSYKTTIKNLCDAFQSELENCGLFEDTYIRNKQEQIGAKIMPLLEYDKPKVMVYGIYNSGKSMLVNSICRKEVAKVADRPMTDCIAEYDAGKYILVDSPGVNAPIDHEEISDRHLENCHMILFVVSSKGIFEDRVNYQKMGDLIRRGIPFYIVLNERAEACSPNAKKEERQAAEQRHEMELKGIKRKIIQNLATYSGVPNVDQKYEVITVNTKRAWDGIEKNSENIYRKSRLSELLGRIDSILEGRGALKQFLAPLSAIEQMIGEAEKDIIAESGNEEYAVRREILQKKIMNFREDFLADIRDIAGKYFYDIYNRRLGSSGSDMGRIRDGICREVEVRYKDKISILARYMQKDFPEVSFEPDIDCGLGALPFQMEDEPPLWEGREEPKSESTAPYSVRQEETEPNIGDAMHVAGSILGGSSFVAPDPVSIGLHILGAFLGSFRNKNKAEQEERELREAVERDNQERQNRIEEDIRRRKDAVTYANVKIDEIVREIRSRLQDAMDREFGRMVDTLDQVIDEKNRRNDAARQFMAKCKESRERIAEIRKEIG